MRRSSGVVQAKKEILVIHGTFCMLLSFKQSDRKWNGFQKFFAGRNFFEIGLV